ncbi:microsomal signal peptidase 25 kDa subunit-domain-containing protein [Haematococcus lacustris]
MAPKVRKLGPSNMTAPSAGSSGEALLDKPKVEPVKVNLYDGAALKSALDDCAREVVIDAGFEENLFISNIKIALGLAAIGFALLAQFGPGKFPSNWWMVAGCVAAYCAVTVILNWFSYKYEGDSYLVTKPSRAGEPGPRLSSRLPKYDDKYTLVISSTLNRKAAGHKEVSLTASVADFFHADGYLSDAAFKPRVEALLKEYGSSGTKKAT